MDQEQPIRNVFHDAVRDVKRTTIMMITLHTYGNDDQTKTSIERLERELKLQGFDAEISDIHTYIEE
jgi:hypothetical protein